MPSAHNPFALHELQILLYNLVDTPATMCFRCQTPEPAGQIALWQLDINCPESLLRIVKFMEGRKSPPHW